MTINIILVVNTIWIIYYFEHEYVYHMCIKYKYLQYYYWHALNTPTCEYNLFVIYLNFTKIFYVE